MNGSSQLAFRGGSMPVMHRMHRAMEEFEALGNGQHVRFGHLLDRWLHWDMESRQQRAADLVATYAPCTVIDIAAGNGSLIPAVLDAGAEQVHAIEPTDRLATMGRKMLREIGAHANVTWQMAPFLDREVEGEYDVSLAIDLYDYLADPLPMLMKSRSMTTQAMAASFPVRSSVRRRAMSGGRERYAYTRDEVDELLRDSGWSDWTVERYGQHWFVVAKP